MGDSYDKFLEQFKEITGSNATLSAGNPVDIDELNKAFREADDRDTELDDYSEEYTERAVLHSVLLTVCAMAILSNVIAIIALSGVKRARASNKTLVVSLCCADLLTAVSILVTVVIHRVIPYHSVDTTQYLDLYARAVCAHKVSQAVVFTGHCATLLSLLALAVDHYCAIGRPLDYPIAMAKERVRVILVGFWVLATLLGFSDFLLPLSEGLHTWVAQYNNGTGGNQNGSLHSTLSLSNQSDDEHAAADGNTWQEMIDGYTKDSSTDSAYSPHLTNASIGDHPSLPSLTNGTHDPYSSYDLYSWFTPVSTKPNMTVSRADAHTYEPATFEYVNYCERIHLNTYEPDLAMFALVGLCLIGMGTLYTLIACVLRRQPYTHVRLSSSQKTNIRGLVTTFFILASFALFWLPYFAFDVAYQLRLLLGGVEALSGMGTFRRVSWYVYALVLVNATIDPVIYAVRMREVHRNLRRVCCKVAAVGRTGSTGITSGSRGGARAGGSGRDESAGATGMLLHRTGRRSTGGSSSFGGHTRMSMTSSLKSSEM